jgi:hypothetical protein
MRDEVNLYVICELLLSSICPVIFIFGTRLSKAKCKKQGRCVGCWICIFSVRRGNLYRSGLAVQEICGSIFCTLEPKVGRHRARRNKRSRMGGIGSLRLRISLPAVEKMSVTQHSIWM